MTKIFYKRWEILLTLLSLFILGGSYYLQYIKGLNPCPLCVMQRLCVLLLFTTCFIGTVVASLKRAKLIVCLQFFFASCGLFFALRQLWLQSLPKGQAPACMPELDILMRYFPWRDVLLALFWGTGDCAESSWLWFGLTMPAWTALYFLVMLVAAILLFWVLHTHQSQ